MLFESVFLFPAQGRQQLPFEPVKHVMCVVINVYDTLLHQYIVFLNRELCAILLLLDNY